MSRTSYILSILIYSILFFVFRNAIFIHLITFTCLLSLFISFSQTIVLLDIIALYSCIIYLSGPALGYKYFGAEFEMARIVDQVMAVDYYTYYDYTLPAISLFIITLKIFRKSNEQKSELEILEKVRNAEMGRAPYIFIAIGFVSISINRYLPVSFQYVFIIMFLLLFAGLSMLIYKRDSTKKDKIIIYITLLWILYAAIKSSMFTIVFYMGITFAGIIFTGKNIRSSVKIAGIFLASALLISLQYTKNNYRLLMRRSVVKEMNVSQFASIYFNNLKNINNAAKLENIFSLYLRFSNGYNLSLVMKRIPERQPFDNGKALAKSIVSGFVPRLVWPTKPMAGGKFNMKYYANLVIDTFTTNVGPIGEAYGSFGRYGGILFMGMFGLFIVILFNYFIATCHIYSKLIAYMPMVFYELNYCMENDTLQAINSVIKISFFLWMLYKLSPKLFRD